MITYLGDQISLLPLDHPAAPTLTRIGAAGETTYTYAVVAVKSTGHTAVSEGTTVTNGPATLSTLHAYDIKPPYVAGALSFDIYRLAGGLTQGKIGSLVPRNISGVQQASFRDSGRVAVSGDAPTENTTGILSLEALSDLGSEVVTLGIRPNADGYGALQIALRDHAGYINAEYVLGRFDADGAFVQLYALGAEHPNVSDPATANAYLWDYVNGLTVFHVTHALMTVVPALEVQGGVKFPDADPHVVGLWWDNGTTLVRSAG